MLEILVACHYGLLDRKPAPDGKMAVLYVVGKFVMGGSHIGTGGDRYLTANRPSKGSRATRQALDDPSRENIAHYLRAHIDDESLVTDPHPSLPRKRAIKRGRAPRRDTMLGSVNKVHNNDS
jgi:hypothetical protein